MTATATAAAPPAATIADLGQHVADLAALHEVELDVRPQGTRARAWRATASRSARVRMAPVRSLVTYYTALHELGHVLGPHPRTCLEREAVAWAWALEHAAAPPTRAVRRMIRRSLGSYHTWAVLRQDRDHVRPVLPPRGHVFWRLLHRGNL